MLLATNWCSWLLYLTLNVKLTLPGELQQGKPEDNISKAIGTEYLGLNFPSPDIDGFFHSIFEDVEIESFMQHLLGYAITGQTREQIFVICCGRGSNGKDCVPAYHALLHINDSLLLQVSCFRSWRLCLGGPW